jgi:hypothetical protein
VRVRGLRRGRASRLKFNRGSFPSDKKRRGQIAAPSLFKRPEPRSAADAARIAVFCGKNRCVCFLAEDVFLQLGRNILVQTRDLRDAAAQYDDIRIEQVDDVRQPACETILETRKRGKSGRFVRCGVGCDFCSC